jgi:glycopeptide antibiotics resistance protein
MQILVLTVTVAVGSGLTTFVSQRFAQTTTNLSVSRNRPVQIALIILVSLLGIGSRRYAHALPDFIAAYAGDTLWALAAFLAIGVLLPRVSTVRVALLAMALSVTVELSQLYHAPWIDSIRQTTLGGLVLGFGFVWSDLACYAAGVGLGVCEEILGRRVGGRREPT